LFHLYPSVTRKRRWRYILDESAPAYELSISEFSDDFLPLNLLLVRSHQQWRSKRGRASGASAPGRRPSGRISTLFAGI